MTPEERLYKDAREAIDKDDLVLARDLLTRLLKINRGNPEYWLWMSGVVATKKERGYCLKEVLKLDPENIIAIRGLRMLGENVTEPGQPVPLSHYLREWKTSLDVDAPKSPKPAAVKTKILAYSLLGVFIVGVVITSIVFALKPRYRQNTSPVMKFSLTPPATATMPSLPTPTYEGPAPLWTLLEATFTPTPLYVSTPHNRTEAYQAAMRAYEKGDWAKAIDYFGQVLEVEPGSVDIQYYISEIYRQQGVMDKALDGYNQCIKMDPSFASAYLGKARALLAENPEKVTDAEELLKKALELDPGLQEAMQVLAEFYVNQGDANSAQLWLDNLLKVTPITGQLELIRAQIYLLREKFTLALTSLEKANRLDPTLLAVYKLQGATLLQELRPEEALIPLITYETYAPNDPEVYILLARAHYGTDDLKMALFYVNKALSGTVKPVLAYGFRGTIYYHQGKIDLAEKDFDNALRLDNESLEGNLGKGLILLEKGYPGAAFEYLNAAVEIAENDWDKAVTLYWRAMALIELDQVSAAIRDLEAFFVIPQSEVPPALHAAAMKTYLEIVTPTPSPTASSTPSSTATATPSPTED